MALELGFTVAYWTFQMDWEIVEKRDGYEVAYRWFGSRKKAEAFLEGYLTVSGQYPSSRNDWILLD